MTDEFMQYAQNLKNQKLFETEALYQSDPAICLLHFQDNFCDVCKNILKMQHNGLSGEISFLEYTLLRTNLMQKKSVAEVRAYHDKWYFDGRQYTAGYFDFSPLFVRYWELAKELAASKKRFPGVSAQEITSFVLSCADSFYRYVISACRFFILNCIDTEPFLSLQRADEFVISAGEYMACSEPIYQENRKRTAKEALEWFASRLKYDYTYESFAGHNFSHADLSEINLDYTDFRNAALTGADFRNARLTGARFCGADLTDADFRGCLLHEADFRGAQLRGARFASARAFRGVSQNQNWTDAGYRSVNFRNADLSHADFRNADIVDADFTGAVMEGTLLLKEQFGQFLLSPQQKQTVCTADEIPGEADLAQTSLNGSRSSSPQKGSTAWITL